MIIHIYGQWVDLKGLTQHHLGQEGAVNWHRWIAKPDGLRRSGGLVFLCAIVVVEYVGVRKGHGTVVPETPSRRAGEE